jgi:hypothetical protein
LQPSGVHLFSSVSPSRPPSASTTSTSRRYAAGLIAPPSPPLGRAPHLHVVPGAGRPHSLLRRPVRGWRSSIRGRPRRFPVCATLATASEGVNGYIDIAAPSGEMPRRCNLILSRRDPVRAKRRGACVRWQVRYRATFAALQGRRRPRRSRRWCRPHNALRGRRRRWP